MSKNPQLSPSPQNEGSQMVDDNVSKGSDHNSLSSKASIRTVDTTVDRYDDTVQNFAKTAAELITTATKAFYDEPNDYKEEQEALHESVKVMHSTTSDLLQTKAMYHSEILLNVYQELSFLLGKYATRQRRVEARGTIATPTTTPTNIPTSTPASVPQMVTYIPTNLQFPRAFLAVASEQSTSRTAIQLEARRKAEEEQRLREAAETKRQTQIRKLEKDLASWSHKEREAEKEVWFAQGRKDSIKSQLDKLHIRPSGRDSPETNIDDGESSIILRISLRDINDSPPLPEPNPHSRRRLFLPPCSQGPAQEAPRSQGSTASNSAAATPASTPPATPASSQGGKRTRSSSPEIPPAKRSVLNTTGSITPPQVWFEGDRDAASILPPIQRPEFVLPPFKGDVLHYKSFMQNFRQFIHCNQNLTYLDKINYLQNALGSTLKEHFEKFPLTNEGYRQRLEYLHEKFGHEGQIQSKIWSSISAIKPKDNSTASLREAYEQLTLFLKFAEGYDTMINPQYLFTIGSKNFTRYLYEHRVTADDSVQHLLCVIHQAIKFKEYYGTSIPSSTPTSTPTKKGSEFR